MITILCGKSACGKDTLQGELIKKGFTPLISTTSRPMRDGEQNGREYNFVSKNYFKSHLNDFLEYRKYDTLVNGEKDTWYYGMPKMDLDTQKDYVVILDLDGAKSFIDYYGKENCFPCYVDVPDSIRTARATERGSFDKTEWNRRLKDDNIKFSKDNVKATCVASLQNTGTLQELVSNFEDVYDVYQVLLAEKKIPIETEEPEIE